MCSFSSCVRLSIGFAPSFSDATHTAIVYKTLKASVEQLLTNSLTHSACSLNDRWGMKDDRGTTFLRSSLSSSAFRRASPNPIHVHSDILSSILFFCLPFLLPPCTVPRRIIEQLFDSIQMMRTANDTRTSSAGTSVHVRTLQWFKPGMCNFNYSVDRSMIDPVNDSAPPIWGCK